MCGYRRLRRKRQRGWQRRKERLNGELGRWSTFSSRYLCVPYQLLVTHMFDTAHHEQVVITCSKKSNRRRCPP